MLSIPRERPLRFFGLHLSLALGAALGALSPHIAQAAVPPPGSPATLIRLNNLAGAAYTDSLVTGVSADGGAVVGSSYGNTSEEQAFRWTAGGGTGGLGFLPNTNYSFAFGISGDGNVVIGESDEFLAFRWTQAGGMIALGVLPSPYSDAWSWANAASADGSVVVGAGDSTLSAPTGDFQAFRWTQAGGMVALGDLPGGDFASEAFDVSADGSVVVGESLVSTGWDAFRWTAAGGMQTLGVLPGFLESSAAAVSADGTTIVGSCFGANGRQVPFRWTATDGMMPLVTNPAFDQDSNAVDVSADGSIIVGYLDLDVLFIWDATHGTRNLREVLVNDYGLGAALTGWTLTYVAGISDDGLSLVGNIREDSSGRQQGFLVTIAPVAPPQIDVAPVAQTVNVDGTTTLAVTASGDDLSYQWQLDGEDIAGATNATYSIASAQAFHAGQYRVVISNAGGSVASASVAVTVSAIAPGDARLLNLSTRGLAQSGDNILIPGFVVSGSGTKRLLVRAVGPTLDLAPINFGGGTVPDPVLALKRFNFTTSTYEDFEANDDWQTNTNAAAIATTANDVGAFELKDDKEAALLVDLPAGQYSVFARDKNDTSGIAIVEVYDADPGTPAATLANISNRGFCGVGQQVMIPGFVISSEGPKTLLVRVVGPTLANAPYNVSGTMADPKLELYRHNFTTGADDLLLAQDNWSESAGATNTAQTALDVSAFALADGSADAAFVVTLGPGVYTVVGSSADGTGSGVVLVELYVVE